MLQIWSQKSRNTKQKLFWNFKLIYPRNCRSHATLILKIFKILNRLKVFFSESAIFFSNLQICKRNYSKSLYWAWNLNKLFTIMDGNFKFQVQDSDLEYFFWRFGDLKNESHFLKKATFTKTGFTNTWGQFV